LLKDLDIAQTELYLLRVIQSKIEIQLDLARIYTAPIAAALRISNTLLEYSDVFDKKAA
jgi:hypothetical protein